MKFERSVPYFKVLLRLNPNTRLNFITSCPEFVANDLMEILYNVVFGRIPVNGKRLKSLKKYQKPILDVVYTKNKKLMNKIMSKWKDKQSGGFLGALIPIALSAIDGILGSTTG